MITKISSKKMLVELLAGIIVYAVIGIVIIFFCCDEKLYEMIGFCAGAGYAAVIVIHMAFSIEKAYGEEEKKVLFKLRIGFIIRSLGVAIIFAILIITKIGDPISGIFGLFAVKVVAYLQPIIHKICSKSASNSNDSIEKGR